MAKTETQTLVEMLEMSRGLTKFYLKKLIIIVVESIPFLTNQK